MRTLYIIAFAIATLSCQETTNDKLPETTKEEKEANFTTLRKEVMTIHDAVMPESSTIIEYTKTIRSSLDSLSEDAQETGNELIAELKQADKAMMEWMRQYDEPEELGLSLDSALIYLNDQKVKIMEVDSLMRTSLENAKEYIENTIE